MKLLVVASEPISAELLRSVAGDAAQEAEVLVIAPATTHSPLRFWVSDYQEDGFVDAVRERFGLPVALGTVDR